MYFMVGRPIKDLLVNFMDRDTILKKSGVTYRYKCGKVDCEEEYIGRTYAERFKEHIKACSSMKNHHSTTGHNIYIDNFCLDGREDQNIIRSIKDTILIRVNDPSLNRQIPDKYQLPHIWDEVLVNLPELKLKQTATQHLGSCDTPAVTYMLVL